VEHLFAKYYVNIYRDKRVGLDYGVVDITSTLSSVDDRNIHLPIKNVVSECKIIYREIIVTNNFNKVLRLKKGLEF
jgi:hypothetical protein